MAIYHLTTKPVSRSGGRSATAAIAYRAAEKIHDLSTGQTFDYTRKRGVEKLGGVERAERVGREITEEPESPVRVLQAATAVVRHRYLEELLEAAVPRRGQIIDRECRTLTAGNQSTP